MPSTGGPSSTATPVEDDGPSTPRPESVCPRPDICEALWPFTTAVLEFWAGMDDIFSEDDALSDEKVRITAGRAYRYWVECRTMVDPNFVSREFREAKKRSRSMFRPGKIPL